MSIADDDLARRNSHALPSGGQTTGSEPSSRVIRHAWGDEGRPARERANPSPGNLGGLPGKSARVAARIANLFETRPHVDRVVVYTGPGGTFQVRQHREQDVGPGFIAVYSRDVSIQQIIEDVTA